MPPLDPRRHAIREDLADARLKASFAAPRYVEGEVRHVRLPIVPVLKAPWGGAMQLTQALLGEQAVVFEEKQGWCWLQLQKDGYVGYVRSSALAGTAPVPTHRVCVPLSYAFPEASIKSQPVIPLPLNAVVSGTVHDEKFLRLTDGHYIFRRHLALIGEQEKDFVAVAEGFRSVPYMWGGKSFQGLDCSGLVQISLQASGIAAPRDSDMQEKELGIAVEHARIDHLQRGDLVFWKGHVAIMKDPVTLLHANGHHLQVVCEPLATAVQRTAATGNEITSIKRLQ